MTFLSEKTWGLSAGAYSWAIERLPEAYGELGFLRMCPKAVSYLTHLLSKEDPWNS